MLDDNNNLAVQISEPSPLFKPDKLYTPDEVREKLNIGKSLLNELIKLQYLKVVRISTRIRRFKGSSLNRLCKEL